jgi:hypothetical protein
LKYVRIISFVMRAPIFCGGFLAVPRPENFVRQIACRAAKRGAVFRPIRRGDSRWPDREIILSFPVD